MINLIHVHGMPIFRQLQLEEALLRTSSENWCLINIGSPPAIVMGISGKPHELIHHDNTLPIIKRFSGGGTVVVDEETLFISFIFQKEAHNFEPYPESIHRWCEDLYKEIFTHPSFFLKENDYVFGKKKFGGNAQYIKKDRWLHHTTFLWDYNPRHMATLLQPPKAPVYRENRSHDEFLCRLKEFYPSKNGLIKAFIKSLRSRFSLQEVDALPAGFTSHRQATKLIAS